MTSIVTVQILTLIGIWCQAPGGSYMTWSGQAPVKAKIDCEHRLIACIESKCSIEECMKKELNLQ